MTLSINFTVEKLSDKIKWYRLYGTLLDDVQTLTLNKTVPHRIFTNTVVNTISQSHCFENPRSGNIMDFN